MFFKLTTILVSFLITSFAADGNIDFIYNGFTSANLSLDGVAEVTSSGLLRLTNLTEQQMGHAFYPYPISFKNSTNGTAFSFSTTFIFGIVPYEYPTLGGHGIAFVIAPTRGLRGALPRQYFGLFNETNNGDTNNHIFAVELDTIMDTDFSDINNNHVGIDINGLRSVDSHPAGYYDNKTRQFKNLTLISTIPMQVWVEYDGVQKRIDVTIAPINSGKPRFPLLSLSQDLSPILNEIMYVGFSSSTSSILTYHYVLGWSFKMNGQAQELNLFQLPEIPLVWPKKRSRLLTIGLLILSICLILAAVSAVVYVIRRNRKFTEELQDWELDYGPHRFKYKDLYFATKGFKEKELLGTGGFGRVYRGILPSSKLEIAVKKISHESRQGMREFIAEIISIGRLRHRNLVQLLGYCRRKEELLLVYDYMPNGSLDKYLYNQPKITLNWRQRFRVIKGVALALFYLHEEWEQVVIHRDVKASNVLLDAEMNGRLGDFGLAKLYNHGTDPRTTRIVGTVGYLAPEHSRTGKATTSTDVYSFGAFLLEVACGRRPVDPRSSTENIVLVDWVFGFLCRGELLEARDPNLGTEYVDGELELVLLLGLLCSHSEPTARPSMRQVVRYLERDEAFPELPSLGLSVRGLTFAYQEGFDDFVASYLTSLNLSATNASSVTESLLSGGR